MVDRVQSVVEEEEVEDLALDIARVVPLRHLVGVHVLQAIGRQHGARIHVAYLNVLVAREVGLMDYTSAEIVSGLALGDLVSTGVVETE